jgi:hypothetical protein
MLYETVNTGVINDPDLPWIPFAPYSNDVMVKYIKCDSIRGETIVLLKAPTSMQLPRHHHTGTVIVYTIKGSWKYLEHDWVAHEGSVVFETAATRHTPVAVPLDSDEVITFNIVQGELLYLDENDNVFAVENWKTGLERYLAYCREHGLTAKDITSFGE